MGANEAVILEQITGSTQSDLIRFFVIVAVLVIPMFVLLLKDKKEKNKLENKRQENYIERESRIIEVITANTEVMAGLKATLETNGVATNSSFARMDERLDSQGLKIGDISADVVQIKTTLDRAISNQLEMKDDQQRILLIVNGMANNG